MKRILLAAMCFATAGFAHNSYTGNYSGAPGKQSCASSCHGGTGGTLVVTGFPTSYQPGQVYRIVIKHNGGSKIVNFNATTRIGTTTTVAGIFAAAASCVLYTGADGGLYASPHSIDSATFNWTAPNAGTGVVNFYASAFQGTTSSSNGQSSKVTSSAAELLTGVESRVATPENFALAQNYPNPFNPSTEISFVMGQGSFATVKVFDILGKEITTLVRGDLKAGQHSVTFNAAGLPSGVYFYRLQTNSYVETRKMLLTK
jgi:hypothetical protein